MIDFIDKTAENTGTPLNRENMMGLQGFEAKEISFGDGEIVERNSKGHTKTTKFNKDGSITETFVGEKTITKTTIFNADGTITEVIS